jgi:hypothetical protein
MTDLLLEDLKNLTSEGMAQILSYEKGEMLGQQKVAANKRAAHLQRTLPKHSCHRGNGIH